MNMTSDKTKYKILAVDDEKRMVRFIQLNEDSMGLIDRIINDALVQTLLEPDSEPEIPTLEEDDLSIPGFELS